MSAAAAALPLAGSNRALRLQRIGLVLGFWLAGLGVYALRRFLMLRLYVESQTSHPWTELSEGGRFWLSLLPIACCCAALAMQSCWLPQWGRLLSRAAAIIIIPPSLLIAAAVVSIGPHRLDSATVGSHQYVLATGGYALSDAIILYEVADVGGLIWRKVSDVFDYPENTALTGDEHLVVSPDGRWLLFARGGFWLDCFRLADGRASRVEIDIAAAGSGRATELDPRRRSARIAALTDLRP